MTLPEDLTLTLENLFEKISKASIAKASADLSSRYRSEDRDATVSFMTSETHRMAYLAVRLPATFSVVKRVLNELRQRLPLFSPTTLCDIGAGPGTASWAAIDVFPAIDRVSLHEKDKWWLATGKKMMGTSSHQSLRNAQWVETDLMQASSFGLHDLTVLSYVVGELSIDAMKRLIDDAWESTSQVISIIEPGTPHGFERIRIIREHLLGKQAHLVAPCPHEKACPMKDGDWCHFSERVARSSLHMAVKDVKMGYEDEKFSYVIASKSPVELPESRILRHPKHHSGHIDLVLCGQTGIENKTVSKKLGVLYKQTRKLDWGDSWPPSSIN